MKYGLISSRSIISEYIDDTDTNDSINSSYYNRIISDAISQISSHEFMEHKVALLDVSNYHANLPDNFGCIIQVAFRDIGECSVVSKLEMAQWVGKHDNCDIEINVLCDSCSKPLKDCHCEAAPSLIINTNELFRNSPPAYLLNSGPGGHFVGGGGLSPLSNTHRSKLCDKFRLIRPRQHSFSNADFHVGGCMNLDKALFANETVEYSLTLESPGNIRLNVRDGQILLAYFALPVDCDGFRLIPDRAEYIEAAKWAIEEKVLYREYRKSKKREDAELYGNAQAQRIKYFSMCRELSNTPSKDEFVAYWRNNMNKVNDNFNSEYNFYRQTNDKYYSVFRNRR